jgi:hypothetical protein
VFSALCDVCRWMAGDPDELSKLVLRDLVADDTTRAVIAIGTVSHVTRTYEI